DGKFAHQNHSGEWRLFGQKLVRKHQKIRRHLRSPLRRTGDTEVHTWPLKLAWYFRLRHENAEQGPTLSVVLPVSAVRGKRCAVLFAERNTPGKGFLYPVGGKRLRSRFDESRQSQRRAEQAEFRQQAANRCLRFDIGFEPHD